MSEVQQGELVVVTGMTGAGRSTAAKELEDLGFYVVDNMPPSLLRDVVRLVDESRGTDQPIAVVVDVRHHSSSISPVAVFTLTVARPCCWVSAAAIASAVRVPMPGTSAISSTVAARSFFRDPKRLSRLLRRTSPRPGTSSSRLSTMLLDRRDRWWVIAKRCASSRIRWRR